MPPNDMAVPAAATPTDPPDAGAARGECPAEAPHRDCAKVCHPLGLDGV